MIKIINIIEVVIGILISIAYITLGERKILGSSQKRKGPNKVGIIGILQPISDGLKLLLKESIIPNKSNKLLFLISPIISISIALIIWLIIPFKNGIIIWDDNITLLLILALNSINIYGILFSGWSSNNRYGIIGSLRAIAQLISYEISISIILFNVIILMNSLNLTFIFKNQIFISNIIPLFPIFILFFISALAESNRHPFDLVEAESELVAGYIVEYGGMAFGSIYLAEYGNIILLSMLSNLLFIGGNNLFTLLFILLFIIIRATLPRFKWNHLISFGWSNILPFSLGFFLFNLSLLFISLFF